MKQYPHSINRLNARSFDGLFKLFTENEFVIMKRLPCAGNAKMIMITTHVIDAFQGSFLNQISA